MHKKYLAFNDLQWLISPKAQPNHVIYIEYIIIKRIWHLITCNG